MSDPTKISPCPICSREGYAVACYDPDQAAQAFAQRRLDPERHKALSRKLSILWNSAPCLLCRCDNCEFFFSSPFVSGDAEFYHLAYTDVSYPNEKWEFDRTRQALRDLEFSEPRLLEIGAGNGAFLKHLLKDGWSPSHLHACELSASGRAAIESMCVKCFEADFRVIDQDIKFDVVCMFQVLEHLNDYEGMFEGLERLLRSGGHLFVATPNGAWISSNEKRNLLLDMPPNHISRWSPRSFMELARRFGWHLDECELEPSSRIQTAVRALTDRFARLVNDESSFACRTAELAIRTGSRRAGRLIKAGAALTSPACVYAALRASLVRATPQNIWAHLRHPG